MSNRLILHITWCQFYSEVEGTSTSYTCSRRIKQTGVSRNDVFHFSLRRTVYIVCVCVYLKMVFELVSLYSFSKKKKLSNKRKSIQIVFLFAQKHSQGLRERVRCGLHDTRAQAVVSSTRTINIAHNIDILRGVRFQRDSKSRPAVTSIRCRSFNLNKKKNTTISPPSLLRLASLYFVYKHMYTTYILRVRILIFLVGRMPVLATLYIILYNTRIYIVTPDGVHYSTHKVMSARRKNARAW